MDDREKDNFYESLISVARKLGKKETVVIVEDFNRHVEKMQKTWTIGMEVIATELRIRKEKGFWSFVPQLR